MSQRESPLSTDISEKLTSIEESKEGAVVYSNANTNVNVNYDLVCAISTTLSKIIESNKAMGSYIKRLKAQKTNAFNAPNPPTISLISFLNRIKTYTEIEDSSLINSMIYIDRICARAKLTLTPLNIHRLIIGSIVSSIKYNEDIYSKFDYYAKVFGISIKELKKIECNFLQMIQYDFFVSPIDYGKYEYYLTHFPHKEE